MPYFVCFHRKPPSAPCCKPELLHREFGLPKQLEGRERTSVTPMISPSREKYFSTWAHRVSSDQLFQQELADSGAPSCVTVRVSCGCRSGRTEPTITRWVSLLRHCVRRWFENGAGLWPDGDLCATQIFPSTAAGPKRPEANGGGARENGKTEQGYSVGLQCGLMDKVLGAVTTAHCRSSEDSAGLAAVPCTWPTSHQRPAEGIADFNVKIWDRRRLFHYVSRQVVHF